MKILLIILIFASCCGTRKPIKEVTKDTITGHWQYTHDEEMEWVKDSTRHNK